MERITIVDDNRQQGMLQSLNIEPDEQHIIIGCGGIGYWLGIMMTLIGATDIVLMDGEKIDNSNLSRLPVPQTWAGINKAVALRKTIRALRPDVRCVCFTTHITPETLNLLEEFTVKRDATNRYGYRRIGTTVWDTTDDAKIQTRINEYVSKMKNNRSESKVVYRKIGYEGFNVGSYNEFQVWTQDNYTTGYRTTSANAVSSALAAGLGFFARYLTPKEDVQIDLRKLIYDKGAECQKRKVEAKEKKAESVKKKKATKKKVVKKKKSSPTTSGTRAPSESSPRTVHSVVGHCAV